MNLRSPLPGSDPARAARDLLTPALAELQRIRPRTELVTRVLDHVAAGTSALYAAEEESTTDESVLACLQSALEELTRALDALHERGPGAHPLDAVALLVAQALAVLYPRVRVSERRRRDALPAEGERQAPSVRGSGLPEQRAAGQRVTVEVDVGVLSESNFYAGVAADVSAGGVFVSTPEPLPEGTEVALYFALEAGRTLHAEGAVRWTRSRTDDLPAGMGVAFTRLNAEDRRAIADFCGNRPPLFHA